MSDQPVTAQRSPVAKEATERLTKLLQPHLNLDACRHGLMVYFNTDEYVGESLRLCGEWAEIETALFAQIIVPGMTVVEVGSNVGTHTLSLAKLAGPNGIVYAFEPQRLLFQQLCGNLALNAVENVYAYQVGLGDAASTMSVPITNYRHRANFAGISLYDGQGERVEVKTLDSYNLNRLDFLKIDVESMERQVLEGGRDAISRFRPLIFTENDRIEKSSSLISYLLDIGYRLWWHLSNPFNRQNYFGRTEDIWSGNGMSNNMICLPKEKCDDGWSTMIHGLPEVQSRDENWKSVIGRASRLTIVDA
jgi:FkbM family methyltransferase